MSSVNKRKEKQKRKERKKNQHFQSAAQTGERLRVSFVDTSFRRERDHVLDQLFVPRPSIFIPSCTVVKIAISPHHNHPSAHLSDHHKLHAPWTGIEHVASVQPLQQVAIIKCPRCCSRMTDEQIFPVARQKSSRRFILRLRLSFLLFPSPPPLPPIHLFFCLFRLRIDTEPRSCSPPSYIDISIDSFYPKIAALSYYCVVLSSESTRVISSNILLSYLCFLFPIIYHAFCETCGTKNNLFSNKFFHFVLSWN